MLNELVSLVRAFLRANRRGTRREEIEAVAKLRQWLERYEKEER